MVAVLIATFMFNPAILYQQGNHNEELNTKSNEKLDEVVNILINDTDSREEARNISTGKIMTNITSELNNLEQDIKQLVADPPAATEQRQIDNNKKISDVNNTIHEIKALLQSR